VSLPPANPDPAGELGEIVDLVNRLALLHGDPERFHLLKDEAARRGRRLQAVLRGRPTPTPRREIRARIAGQNLAR
jgi:hypothetical protein